MNEEDSRDFTGPDALQPDGSAATYTTLLSPRAKLAIFAVLIVAVLAFFATQAIRSASVYYLTVGELEQTGPTDEGRSVRVAGKLVKESFERAPNGLDVSFKIKDESGGLLPVAYRGEVGQLFFNDHSELILEGRYGHDGVFSTDTLIVKCPTKYVNVQEEANEAAGGWADAPYQTEVHTADAGA